MSLSIGRSAFALIGVLAVGTSGRSPHPVRPLRPLRPLRPPAFDVAEATIPQIQAALADGRTTSVALVGAYLARIAAYDTHGPRLNSILRLNPRARAEAASLDAERRRGKVRGPLHGVPIILKDNYGTEDGVTSAGSLALADSRPGRDAFVVAKLRAAGAIILAKSNMHELAAGITTVSSLGGQTRNAYDPSRCPGGSSGGTGVAIAASFAAVGWGSDTCGSIRIPAAYGSLFGLRPTQGLASRRGIVPLSHTQDVPGPLARTVTDLAIALDVTVGPDSADADTRALTGRGVPHFVDSLSATALRGARIGILTNYFADADPIIADTVRAAVRGMRALGAEVVDVTIPNLDSLIAGTTVINMEMKFDLLDYLRGVPNAPVKSLHDILDRGLYHASLENRFRLIDTVRVLDSDAHRKALAKRDALHATLVSLLDSLQLDALAYPTMRQRPATIGDAQAGSTCALAAQSGLPALSAPAGFTSDGLPVGLELMGRPFADARLVAMAFAFEQAGPRRRPPRVTPSLIARRAPAVPIFTVVARAAGGVVRSTFAFDSASAGLSYDLAVSGVPNDRLEAVVLRRVDSTGAERVVAQLAGPGVARTDGRVTLTTSDRRALSVGNLRLALFIAGRAPSGNEGILKPPRE